MEIKNIRSYPVELHGQVVEAGGVIDVDDALAERLLEQPDNWQAKPKSTSKPSSKES